MEREIHLHAMFVSCGHQIVNSPSYDWDGLRRGDSPMALFQYTLAGKGRLLYESKAFEIPQGHAMLVHIPHGHRYHFPEGWLPWEFLYVCLNGTEVLRIWQEIERRRGPVFPLPDTCASVRLAADMLNRAIHRGIASAFEASALAYHLAMGLMRDTLAPQASSQTADSVQRAVAYCRENFKKPIGIHEIAKAAGCSRYHFGRIFHGAQGISPWAFLVNLRIEEAVRLLRTSDFSIKEIAARCGFSEANYFCKLFRKKIGVSPGIFRKSGLY